MLTVKERLSKDHEQHERLLQGLADAVEARVSPEDLRRSWVRFERSVLDHLEAEERWLFSVFSQVHGSEILALRSEHRKIRYAIIELSVSVELHTAKKSALDGLMSLLREHTEHEDRTLHEWLEKDEGISSQRAILTMLARRAHAAEQLDRADTHVE